MKREIQIFDNTCTADRARLADRIRDFVLVRKLPGVGGLLILLGICLVFTLLIAYKGVTGAALICAGLFAPAVLFAIVAHPRFGICVLMIMAYLLFYIMRQGIDFPLGTVMDGIQLLLILGFFIRQKVQPDWSVFRGPVSTMILIWIFYNVLEIANPVAESRLAWVYTIRSVAMVMLMYFVFMYQIRTISMIRVIAGIWIVLSIFAALYAYKQEYIGFTDAENAWLYSDPNIANLLFIAGRWRKFSIFSDPVAFSYNMVVSTILCIALLTYTKKLWKKVGLIALIALFFSSMLFSGTRGAYVLLPAAMGLFLVLKFNTQVLIGTGVAALFMLFLIFVPTSNSNIVRFQTAFKPSEDISFQARTNNQKRIQPYILTHPMGGGLGATGAWGQRFAPHSFLANFPPDSGYVRIAVELGWIGLGLFCLLMFFILRQGINNYFLIQNEELRMYCLGMVMIIFAYNIGNYPQEALVQFPSNIYFYLATALINVTKRIDDRLTAQETSARKI